MKYINTLPQTRSQNRPWLSLDAPAGIPAGVVTSIQITTTSNSPIYVAGLDVVDGLLSMTLSQDSQLFASVITDQSNAIVTMQRDCDACISAVIQTGVLNGITASYYNQAKIRSCFIYVQQDVEQPLRVYDITVDGILHKYSDLVELTIDTANMTYTVQNDGTVFITMTPEQRNQFNRVATDAESEDQTLITSINGITPDAAGILYMTVSYGTYGVIPLTRVNNQWVTIKATDVSHIPACDVEDYVDTVLSPANIREYTKMPLDDAYTQKQTDDVISYVRNYKLLEQRRYAYYYSVNGLSLYERNPLHDTD